MNAVVVLILAVHNLQFWVRRLGSDPLGALVVLKVAGLRERLGEIGEGVPACDLVGRGTGAFRHGGGQAAEDAVGLLVVL